ncbi:MAG: hypothetical protein J6D87_03550 [Clostridia bacterium]|nr:hypothetical protein [Clostridia bacterium]
MFPRFWQASKIGDPRPSSIIGLSRLSTFEIRPKIVTLSWWNEWTAQRLQLEDGEYVFVDNYNREYSRDIEPMEGGHGDQYYKWMIEYISAYKGHLTCPVLVEKNYENQVEEFVNEYKTSENS